MLPFLPPGSAFSHTTAAHIHELPMPRSIESDERIHVVRPLPNTQVRRPDVVGHRALHQREIVVVDGLPVVGLADTWVDFGELVGRGKPVGLDDTIVLGDAVATRLNSTKQMRISLARRNRPRGKRTLAEGLLLIRVGSRSPRETISRIMLVRVGLPEPEINVPVYSEADPTVLLGVADLYWRLVRPDGSVVKVVGEYQGEAFHSSPDQRRHDLWRRRGFEDDDWLVEWMWAIDLRTVEARELTCLRFAAALGVPAGELDLSQCESRFFSQHRMDEAIQSQQRWSMRYA